MVLQVGRGRVEHPVANKTHVLVTILSNISYIRSKFKLYSWFNSK